MHLHFLSWRRERSYIRNTGSCEDIWGNARTSGEIEEKTNEKIVVKTELPHWADMRQPRFFDGGKQNVAAYRLSFPAFFIRNQIPAPIAAPAVFRMKSSTSDVRS